MFKSLLVKQPKPTGVITELTPELHLDGNILRASFDNLVDSTDNLGGIEVIVEGLIGKSILFQRTFSNPGTTLSKVEFFDACAFIPTVRRRLKIALNRLDFDEFRVILHNLLDNVSLENVDLRLEQLADSFPADKKYRWLHDLATEILHYRDPETFPLMNRWVWDFGSNTGVLREIWYSEYQPKFLNIPNNVRTYLELRRELIDFVKDLGVFRNQNFIVDILCAWVYSQYINSQGGSFLKTEFSAPDTTFDYALRMLGLDAALNPEGKTKLILPNGKRYRLSQTVDAITH